MTPPIMTQVRQNTKLCGGAEKAHVSPNQDVSVSFQ